MDLTHKSLSFEVKLNEATRRISGYASVFGNVDSYGDVVLAGAFKGCGSRKPKMLYQHKSSDVIGVWDVMREDSKGLYVEGIIANTPLGEEVYTLAKMGALDSLSIGYNVIDSEYDSKGIRLLKNIDLWEVSVVTFPANDQATLTSVKSLEGVAFENLHNHKDKIEAALRDAGASIKAAKYVASLVQPLALRDAGNEELSNSINNAINTLKGKKHGN
jgi:HK97 family phage prohead protease